MPIPLPAASVIALVMSLAAFSLSATDVRVALVDGAVEVSADEALDASWQERVAVRVHDPDEAGANDDRPAILGSYEIVGGKLRFRPMFPFEPGMSYRVTVDAGGDAPAVTVLRMPARDREPTTVVTKVYPSTGVLPENQLKLYVHFSAPMAGGDGLVHVRLLDETGAEVVDPFLPLGEHFWDPDRRRYTIFFDPGRVKQGILPNEEMGRPILDGKHYRLAIDGDWRDDDGLPLASGFEKVFRAGPADTVPLDTSTWDVAPPQAGTREPLVVRFPEPLDHEILLRGLWVEKDGRPVRGQVSVEDDETRWSFEPSAPWPEGPHVLVASGDLEDLAGNRIGQPFEVDVFERIERPEERESYPIPFRVRPAR